MVIFGVVCFIIYDEMQYVRCNVICMFGDYDLVNK